MLRQDKELFKNLKTKLAKPEENLIIPGLIVVYILMELLVVGFSLLVFILS